MAATEEKQLISVISLPRRVCVRLRAHACVCVIDCGREREINHA